MPASPALSNSSLQFNSQLANHSINSFNNPSWNINSQHQHLSNSNPSSATTPLNLAGSWHSPSINSPSIQSTQPVRSPEEHTNQNFLPQLISQVITAIGLNAEFDRSHPNSSVRRYDPRTLPTDPRTNLRLSESTMANIEQAYLLETCSITELKLYKDYLINQHQLKTKLHDHPPLVGSPSTPNANVVGLTPAGLNNPTLGFTSATPGSSGQAHQPQVQSAPQTSQQGFSQSGSPHILPLSTTPSGNLNSSNLVSTTNTLNNAALPNYPGMNLQQTQSQHDYTESPRHSNQRPLGPAPPTGVNPNFNSNTSSQQTNQQNNPVTSNTSNQSASSPTAVLNSNQQFTHPPSTPVIKSHIPAPPSPTQSQRFMATLYEFSTKSNPHAASWPWPPTIDGEPVDLFKLFSAVQHIGGAQAVVRLGAWGQIASIIELTPSNGVSDRRGSQNGSDGLARYSPEQIQQLQKIFVQYVQPFGDWQLHRRRHLQQQQQQQQQQQASLHPTQQSSQTHFQQSQLAQQHLNSLQSSISSAGSQNLPANWAANPQNAFVGSPVKTPLHQTQPAPGSQHPQSASPPTGNPVSGARNASMNWSGNNAINTFINSPAKTTLHPQQNQNHPPPSKSASQHAPATSSLPSANPAQNPGINWPGATASSYSGSPVATMYNHSEISSHSPGGTANPGSWSGSAPTSLISNLYNQPSNNNSINHQFNNNSALLNHQHNIGAHPAGLNSSASPTMNANLSLSSSSIGVSPTTPQINSKNVTLSQLQQESSILHAPAASSSSNPANGPTTPVGSRAGSPGSLVGSTSESVSNISASLPNSSNGNGKRARANAKKLNVQDSSLKNSNLNNSNTNLTLDKKKRRKKELGSKSPLVSAGILPPIEFQNGISGSRTPSVSSNHPHSQVSPSFQGESDGSSTAHVPMPLPGAPGASRHSMGPPDQKSFGLHQSTHSQQPSPAGGTIVELMSQPVPPSGSVGTGLTEKHDGNPSNPSTPSQVGHHSSVLTNNPLGSRSITPSTQVPPTSVKQVGLASNHISGSPLKGKPINPPSSHQLESVQPPQNGIQVQPRPKKSGTSSSSRSEFVPLCKPVDQTGGWDLKEMDEIYGFRMSSKPRRTLDDLGLVDVHSLVMSLKSRIGSEVTYALNTLSLIGPHLKLYREDNSGSTGILSMPLSMCEDLLEELLDLLEDVAFTSNLNSNNNNDHDDEWIDEKPMNGFDNYLAHAIDEEARLPLKPKPTKGDTQDSDDDESNLRPPIGQVEMIFSILNILRSFGMSDESVEYIGQTPRTTSLLTALCELGPSSKLIRKSLRLSKLEKLRIRREVLQIIADVGHGIELEEQSDETISALLKLVLFFLSDFPNQIDRTPFEGEGITGHKSGAQASLAQMRFRSLSLVPSHVDAAISLISKVGTLDGNRRRISESISKTNSEWVPEALIEILTRLIPMTGEEMLLVVSEEEMRMRAEVLAMALFNLVSLKPSGVMVSELENRMKRRSALMRCLVRTIGKFLVPSDDQISLHVAIKAPLTHILIERLVETMKVLYEESEIKHSNARSSSSGGGGGMNKNGVKGNSNSSGRTLVIETPPLNWFGGGFEDDESEKEIGSSLMIQDDDDDNSEEGGTELKNKIKLIPNLLLNNKKKKTNELSTTTTMMIERPKRQEEEDGEEENKRMLYSFSSSSVKWRSEFIKMLAGIGSNHHLQFLQQNKLVNNNNNNNNNDTTTTTTTTTTPLASLITPNLFNIFVKILD